VPVWLYFLVMHVETIAVTSTGKRTLRVRCERCSCEYEYEMIRRGTGHASLIGSQESSTKRATKQSEKRLERSLARDAEPVACPQCGWLQRAMVAEVRRRHHRWMATAGWMLACISLGAAAASSVLWTNGFRPPPWGEDFQHVKLGLEVLVPLGLSLVLARYVMARNYDPNVSASNESPLPATPAARTIKSGKAAATRSPSLVGEPSHSDYSVTLQLAHFKSPPYCFACLTPTQLCKPIRIFVFRLLTLDLHVCEECQRRRQFRLSSIAIASASIGAAIAFVICSRFGIDTPSKVEITFAATLGAIVLTSLLASNVSMPFRVRDFSADRNVAKLVFENEQYFAKYLESAAQGHSAPDGSGGKRSKGG
jgi:hypothetical protein